MVNLRSALSLLLILFATSLVSAQDPTPSPSPKPPECTAPVYKGSDTDKRARILKKPDPDFFGEDRLKYENSKIILRAILCGSGKVTDIKVVNGLTKAMDEAAFKAARKIEFEPGERNGEKISTAIVIEYRVRR